jgi:hypothetical protein
MKRDELIKFAIEMLDIPEEIIRFIVMEPTQDHICLGTPKHMQVWPDKPTEFDRMMLKKIPLKAFQLRGVLFWMGFDAQTTTVVIEIDFSVLEEDEIHN